MKKVLLLPVLAVIATIAISSCSKCQVCSKPSEPEVRLCKGDYGSETEFGLAVDIKEAQGYACKASL